MFKQKDHDTPKILNTCRSECVWSGNILHVMLGRLQTTAILIGEL